MRSDFFGPELFYFQEAFGLGYVKQASHHTLWSIVFSMGLLKDFAISESFPFDEKLDRIAQF